MGDARSAAEQAVALMIEGWVLQATAFFGERQQIHGWFFGHPGIGEGHYGHSSLVFEIDESIPPRWRVAKRASTGLVAATVRPSARSG